jgi:hypothetical protein
MSNDCGVLLPNMNSRPFNNICANHFALHAHHASMYWHFVSIEYITIKDFYNT